MNKIITSLFASILFFSFQAFASAEEDNSQKTNMTKHTATFAGGCFWCLEAAFDKHDGIIETISGYTGGHKKDPTYNEISSASTGHFEALRITYDSQKISYEKLLDIFWKNVDPLDANGQFCDKGPQYKSAIFYENEQQKKLAEDSLKKLQMEKFKGQKIATEIHQLKKYYDAEDYHQNYHKKNPIRYKLYSTGCGRARRLKQVWQ